VFSIRNLLVSGALLVTPTLTGGAAPKPLLTSNRAIHPK
jgi:hypothetical protein